MPTRMTPLSENDNHQDALCAHFSLGQRLRKLTSVQGGFHHSMWDLATSEGRYAIKQLAPDTDMRNPKVLEHFECSETVSVAFAHVGIPALHALGAGEKALQVIDDTGYLIYPWTNARALRRDEIEKSHVQQVAEIFARMHGVALRIEGLAVPKPEHHGEEKLRVLLDFARSRNSSRSDLLRENLPLLERILKNANHASWVLSARNVASHGDLDHKNVLWNSPVEPLLIDWESAQYVNPTHEVILEALDWSGITLDFKQDLFDCFIERYLVSGGEAPADEVEAAFDCVQGDWVNWLMYNLGRSIDMDDEVQRHIGLEQVDLAMVAILHLQRVVPGLLQKLGRP